MQKALAIGAFTCLVMTQALKTSAQTTPPGNGGASTNTSITAPAQLNNVTSNPVGQNTNVQSNYNYTGVNAFGPGIQCDAPYIASQTYQNNGSQKPGPGGSGQVGFGIGLVVPLAGEVARNCRQLSREILFQRQLDTLPSGACAARVVAPTSSSSISTRRPRQRIVSPSVVYEPGAVYLTAAADSYTCSSVIRRGLGRFGGTPPSRTRS